MKRSLFLASLLVLTAMFFSACKKADDPVTPPVAQDAIVNTWISDGSDVAIGLKSALKTKKIAATFSTDNTYVVVATDSTGNEVTYKGTYSTSENTGFTIRNIVLNQTVPTSVSSTGIYEVASGNLKYEVIQTTPAINGWTAPTAAKGFGSTAYNNAAYAGYIQGFVPSVPAVDPIMLKNWLSDGANVAPGLKVALKTKNITAVFNADQSYVVVATDSLNAQVTYKGTFTSTANTGTSMRSITLNQTVPTSVQSTGIYQVTTTGLTYEVIQTTPAVTGFTAPTVAGGFGSTAYNTAKLGTYYIQKFVKN